MSQHQESAKSLKCTAKQRGVEYNALSDSADVMSNSRCVSFTREYKAIAKEYVVIYQKSLRALFQAPRQML